MPLEWKTSKVGGVSVTHLSSHNPRDLVAALRGQVERIGGIPIVYRCPFGSNTLAVRFFPKHDAERHFGLLKGLAGKRAAVLEMPIALLHETDFSYPAKPETFRWRSAIVTLWKKHENMLTFLEDPRNSFELKKKACLSAVRKVALLTAAGVRHVHLKAENFVASKSGTASLIDYTIMYPIASEPVAEREKISAETIQSLAGQLSGIVHSSPGGLGATKPGEAELFKKKLIEEYLAYYEQQLKRLGA